MQIFKTIEPAVTESPNPQASDTQAPSPEQNGVFDLMLSQLMQAIMSMPVQAELPAADQEVQAGDNMLTTLLADGASEDMTSKSPLTSLHTVQSAFAATIREVLDGVAPQGDELPATDQGVQAKDNMATMLLADGASEEMASMSPLSSLHAVQSAFAATIKEVLNGVAAERETIHNGSIRQAQTALQEALSSISDQTAVAADEGINLKLTVRPDSKEGQMASLKSAELVQMPVDAVKKASAIEAQQPQVMREIILAEGGSRDMADLPEAQKRMEKTSLPETPPVNSAGPQGMIRFHAEPAESPAAVTSVHHLSERMHVEGNRFVITRLDGTSIEISLQSEGMGKLDIGLVLDKGVVNAQIQASSAAGKELVEKHMPDIVNALAQEGIAIGGFSVSLKDDRNDFSGSQGQSQGHQIRGEPVMTKEYISAPRQLISRGMVSIFI